MHNISFSKAGCKPVPHRWERTGGGSSKKLHLSLFQQLVPLHRPGSSASRARGWRPVPKRCRGFTAESFSHISIQGACTEPQGKTSVFPDQCSAAISKSKDRFFSEENFYGLWNLGEKGEIFSNHFAIEFNFFIQLFYVTLTKFVKAHESINSV